MTKRLISLLVANLFLAAPAFAQDMKVEGSVSLGGINTNDDNPTDASKLHEYRDLSSGTLSAIDLKGRGGAFWFDLFGENFARDDQFIGIRGGMDGQFRFGFKNDQLRHNFLYNGRSPYTNPGGTVQSAPGNFPRLDQGTWTNVDVSYRRRDQGLMFEVQALNPWYFRAEGNTVRTDGNKYGSSSQGLSPGNGYVDQAFPVAYETKNAEFEAGYSTKTMHFALNQLTSKFDNSNEFIQWQNGFWSNGQDRTYLPPDNKYSRLAGNGTIRQLPLNSTFAFRFTSDRLKSDSTLPTTTLGIATGQTVATQLATGPNVANFNGKVENDTYSLSIASTPMKGLDTRLYYNRQEREDGSTHVAYQGPASNNAVFENELFSYDKKYWGFDAFYRINRTNRIGAGYEDLDTQRERFDFDKTRDKRWFAEWKTTVMDNLTARVKYQNLDRKSNFLLANDGANSNDVLYWNRFLKAYDATDLDQDYIKVTADWSPIEYLDLSLEYTSKENTYVGQVLGRTKDERSELYASVSYGDPSKFRITAFADNEDVKYQARHRVVGSSTAPGAYDPATPDTASNYNWEGTAKDKNWAFGFALDWPVLEKLMLKASAIYYKTDGSLDFAAPSVIAAATYPQPVANYDDAKTQTFTIKGIYTLDRQWSFTAGYTYEKYDYKDAQFDGYRYVITNTNLAQTSYLNGYYAAPQYKANIFYGMVTYRF